MNIKKPMKRPVKADVFQATRRGVTKLFSRSKQSRTRWIRSTADGRKFFVAPLPNRSRLLLALSIVLALIIFWVIATTTYHFFGPHNYRVSHIESILSKPNEIFARSLTFDEEKNVYTFVHGTSAGTPDQKQSGATTVSASIPVDAGKGVVVTDPNYKIDVSMKPRIALAAGKKDSNRVIYPFRDHGGWLVYTATGTGIKEDIVLDKKSSDSRQFSYELKLPDGTEARLEKDGSVGVYGNQLFISSITPATDADASLLEKARKNATKNLLLFTIPKPTVIEKGRKTSNVKAKFTLHGNTLTVTAQGLSKAQYPLSIDPSIYVVTAQQFMTGNNETNIDFDVTNKLIKKSPTTGARFDKWNATMPLNSSKWKQGVAAAGGYLYTVGGIHPEGGSATFTTAGTDTFVVPAGITSITVKAWGAGGGGGGAGGRSDGGAGGGGGYATSTISVSPGDTLTISVGGGGSGGTGGGSNNSSGAGGGGGGYSRVARGTNSLLIAAGGAGGGGGGRTSGYTGGAGGGGGGTSGQNGSAGAATGGGYGSGANGATGGSSNTPSLNTGTSGSSLQGGAGADGRSSQGSDGGAGGGGVNGGGNGGARDVNTYYAGAGGGGGGYAGGGGGSSASTSSRGAGGGGGGSSYLTGTNSSTASASGTTPGNSADTDRSNAGNSGSGGTSRGAGTSGSNGIVQISYDSDTGATDEVSWARFSTNDGTIESTNPGDGVCSGWCSSSQYKLPAARSKFSLVAYNGFLYVIGGEDQTCQSASGTGDNGICNTVYVAKLGANGEPQLWHPTDSNKSNWSYWYRDTNLTSPRSSIKAIAYNNRLYLMGGTTSSAGSQSVTNSMQIADLSPDGRLGTWGNSTTLPYSAYGYTSVAYNDRLYLIGGASSIGGAPLASIYYNKINNDGSLNSWQQTTSMPSGRMSNGGDFGAVWGAYFYISGGCTATNSSGYCTTIANDTQVASLNADGTLDIWNTVGGVNDTRTGHSLVTWRGTIYEIGGCSDQNATTGSCTSASSDIKYGTINQDGDASTVGQTAPAGSGDCTGITPSSCNLPGTTYTGNMLSNSFISNGYLYVIGGCSNNGCSTATNDVAYVSISSTGTMEKPASCPAPRTIQGNIWCVDTTNTTPTNLAAASPVVFNGRIYLVGGLTGGSNSNTLIRADINQVDGSLSAWTNQSLSSLFVNNVSYLYAFARANPADAQNNPGNLYILGGCASSSGAGCTAYSQNVYKCNIQSSGAVANCTTSGQLQIGVLPGDSQTGLGIMSGTVYANYIYLIGGVSPNLVDLDSVRYAKIDDNNNIVAVNGSSWIESAYKMSVGRRRSASFGYNGYLYAVGGYEAASGVLADIEFIKINVSDGSLSEGWKVSNVKINQRWGLTVPVSNSYAYVIGGCTSGASPSGCTTRTDVIQTFQIYNNDSGTPAGYSNTSNIYSTNQQRIGASAAMMNGRLFVAGGCTGATDCTSPVSTVSSAPVDANGTVGTWTDQAALPQARGWGKLVALNGSLYYIGGQDSANTAQSTVYFTTPSGGTVTSWSSASNALPQARSKFGVASWNGRIYVVGGLNAAGSPTNTIYQTPQLFSGGNISSAWLATSTTLPVARSGLASVAYANNLYVFGGIDTNGNYLSDSSYSQLNSATGSAGDWRYSTTLPKQLADAEAVAANGYIYLVGGRDSATTCAPSTLIAPVSANTTVASGNVPTGVGEWSATNQRFIGNRYGAATVYNEGKLYVIGGGCGGTLAYPSSANTIQQTSLLSQPQVAKYSIMMDTDSDVFPSTWLMNGVDNSIGARWQLKYRSMTNQQTANKCAAMTTWGQETNFGNVGLGTPGLYTVKDSSGADVKCARYFYFNVTVDSSQAYGYPDDVSRGPTITDLTLQFTADPSKRLMHGRTFTGGLQMPVDTPQYGF
jgi:N-acetylneuraminic acid mutarotase